ncbi:MAG: hypothetical protein PHR19_02425 [Bacteroidales bacterium]|nr:hypothetical protein [Bacteroidales bacterium]
MKIIKNKKYKTRLGLDVKIYEIYEEFNIIHGAAIDIDGKPVASLEWDLNGETYGGGVSGNDLIEVSPYADFKIDDKVFVWDEDIEDKEKKHFAGLDVNGLPTAWYDGRTSFTETERLSWEHCIKYEENND